MTHTPLNPTPPSPSWLASAWASIKRQLTRRNAQESRQQAAAMRNKELRAAQAARRERQS